MAAPLPPGPERSRLLAAVALLSLANMACAAPYLPDGLQQSKQPSPLDFISPFKGGMIGPLFRPNDHTSVDLKAVGCYYQFNHYEEGDRIVTNEPCLNCTCHNSMLMCYLKVCPFSKPIGLDCTIEKSPEQCCPVITCPQVPVNLQVMHMTTSTTTASPVMQMTGIVPYVEHGCTMEGDYYPDGAQMPGNSSKPCELCYCIRNHTACIMQECILKVEGCIPVFQEGICCPVRYKCEGDKPIFPRIEGPEISDSYATVIYQPKDFTTSTTAGTTVGTPAGTTAVPDTTTGEPIAGTTSPSATESQSQTDDPEMQFITGSGARRSKAHEDDDYLLTTTQASAEINATTGLPVTTMIPGSGAAVCVYQDEIYADGASISTEDPCQHCYCMNGDLVCAVHDCKSSLDEAEEGCVPRPPLPGQCCPQGYDCPDQMETSSILPDISTEFISTVPDTSTDVPDPEKHNGSDPTVATPTISDAYSHEYGPIATDEDSVLTRMSPGETSQTDPVDEAVTPEAVTSFSTDTEPSSTPQPTADKDEEVKDTTAAEESETTTKSPEELLITDDALSAAGPPHIGATSSSITPSQESDVTDSSVSTTVKETATTEQQPEDPVTEQYSTLSPQPAAETDKETLGESESTTSPETEGDRLTTEGSAETTTESKDPSESTISTPSSEKPVNISMTETETSLEPAEEKEPEEESPEISSLPEVTTPGIPGEGDCMMNGTTFSDGDIVPTSSVCEESCMCRDSVVVCKFKSCSAPPPSFLRCTPAEISGECCPRYDCPEPQANNTCEKDGSVYEDGATVPSDNVCNECFCTDGKIICAIRECVPPPSGCVATPRLEDSCCPSEYECPSATPDVGDLVMVTEKPATVKPYGNSCTEDGKVFNDGSPVPSTNICHLTCACKNGEIRCVQKACPPPPPAFLRCVKVEDASQCCPSYECPPPAVGAESACRFYGNDFADGELVPSYDKCEECRCIEGEVICAELKCIPPGPNCVPTQEEEEMCCPSSYDCSNATEIATPTSPVFSSVTEDYNLTGSPFPSEIGKISPDDATDTATDKTTESDVTSTEDSTTSKATTTRPVETTSPSEDSSQPEVISEDTAETVTDKTPESGVTSSVDFVTSEASETFTSPGMTDTTSDPSEPSDSGITAHDTTDTSTTKTPDDEDSTPNGSVSSASVTTPKSTETTSSPYEVSEPEATFSDATADITTKIPEIEVSAPEDSTSSELSEAATTPAPVGTSSVAPESSDPEMQADSTAQEDPKLTYGLVTEESITIDDDDKTTPPLVKEQAVTEAPYSETTKTEAKPDETEDSTDVSLTTETDLRTSEATKPEESQDADIATTVDFESIGSSKTPLTTASGTEESTTRIYSPEIATESSFPSEDDKEAEFTGIDDSSTTDSVTPGKDLGLESALTTEVPVKLEISTDSQYSSPDDLISSEEEAVSVSTGSTLAPIDESTSSVASVEPSSVTQTSVILEEEDETHEATVHADGQTTPSVTTDRITTPLSVDDTTISAEPQPEKESTEIPRATDDVEADTVTMSDATTPASMPADPSSATSLPEVTTSKQEADPTSTSSAPTAKPTQDDVRFTDALPDIGDSTLYKVPPKETSAPEVDSSEFSTTTEIASTSKPAVTSPDAVTVITDEEEGKTVADGISESPAELSTAMPTKTSVDDMRVTPSDPATKTEPPEETDLSTSISVSEDPIEITTEIPSVEYTSGIDSSTTSPASEPVTIASGADEETATTESAAKTSLPDLFEGSCLVEGVTYFDGEVILSLSFQKCQGKCICNKSVVECNKPACPPPPPQHLNCKAVVKPQQCCPSFACDDLSPGDDSSSTCEQYGETYKNGQYVPTNFECSDCYCIDSEVVCAKVQCQQPIGNCTPLDVPPGKCCPSEYKCTEKEPAQAPATTPVPTDNELLQPTTPIVDEDDQSCIKDGVTYLNGQTMPVSNACQESCKCASGSAQCKLQACPPPPPPFLSCVAQEKPDQCCPSYDCPSGIVNATESTSCVKDGIQYQTGELVPSSDHCSDCYCLDGAVTCAPLQCQAPAPNCTPGTIPEGSCCPTDYDCSDVSPTFGIETDYTPDLTFSSVDETTEGTESDSETAVTTEGYKEAVTESLSPEATTQASEQEISTSLPGSPTVSPSVSETDEETESESTPLTETTDEPDALVTDGAPDQAISTTPALEEGACVKDQVIYSNGTEIPSSTPCEEMCACIDGVVRCELQACPPAPPAFLRCSPIDQPDQCCPSYDCPEVQPDPTSTTNCKVNETEYTDGEYVPSSSYCTDCYCSEGEVVCATIDCEAPGENCLPIEIPEGSCCPTRYSCADTPLTVPTDDYTFSVDSISTRITEDDRTESEVTVPEPDSKQTVEGFTTVPSVDDSTSTEDAKSVTIEKDVTEKPGEPDVPSVTTSTQITTKGPESTSSQEFIPSTTPSSVDEEKTTIGATDIDTETESPSTAPEESEISDVTATTTESHVDDTTESEITSVTDTSVTSKTQTDPSSKVPSEKPEEIFYETTPLAEESDTTTPATDLEGTTTYPSDDNDCIVDDIVFSAGSSVPVTNSCQESCICSEGTVQCDQTACPPAPPAFFKCTQAPTDGCCPSYNCAFPSVNETSGVCEFNGTKFSNGQYIPSGTICKDCYCIDSEVVCATIDCPVPGPNCYAIRQSEHGCCPENYRCDLGVTSTESPATTPVAHTFEMSTRATDFTEEADDVPTTVAPSVGCIKNDRKYRDGEIVESENKCEDCFCSDGRVLCSALECIPPGENCTAVENSDDECCPTKYECDDQPTPSLSIPSTVPDVKYTDKPLDDVLETRDTIQPTDTTEGDIPPESVTTATPTDTTEASSSTHGIDETVSVTEAFETAVDDEFTTVIPKTATEASSDTTDEQSMTEVESVTQTSSDADSDVTKTPEEVESTGAPVTPASTEEPAETSTDVPVIPDAPDAPTATEVSTDAEPDDTTDTSELMTTTEIYPTGCSVNEIEYGNGDSVPPNECQDSCVCSNGEVSCRKTACPPAPPAFLRCAVENTDGCCPTYQCPNETESTTFGPTCFKEGIEYSDGEHVPSDDLCSDCFCIDGRIICATLECEAPGPRCTPAPVPEGICCPEAYDCVEEMGDVTATPGPLEERKTDAVYEPESTTILPLSSDTTSICTSNGIRYEDGEAVSVQNSCQETCSCQAGEVLCILKKCPDKPPSILRCSVTRNSTDECCPSYECPQPAETDQPSCERDGISYMEGEYVNSTNVCTDCHCIDGDIVCATLECEVPSARCTPLPPTIEECCPSYLCPGEIPTEMVPTTADSDDTTASPEIPSEQEMDTESPADATESSDADSLPEDTTDIVTESVAEEATEATEVSDQVTDETVTISSMDSVTESTDTAIDSITESAELEPETTDVPAEVVTSDAVVVTSGAVETSPVTEEPSSTIASGVSEEDKTTGEPTDETTEVPSVEDPLITFTAIEEDKEETTEQSIDETPSQPESSPDPSPSDDLDETVPIIKSTDTTDATTQTPTGDAQTTLSTVELVTESSTDSSTDTEKQPEDVTEFTSESSVASSSSTTSSETTTATYEVTETTPEREPAESTPASEIIDEVTDKIETSTLSSSDISEDSTSPPSVDKELEEVTTVSPDDDVMSCQMNETIYSDGDAMPAFSSCQHSCKCSNGTVKCERESCPPTPPQFLRCSTVPDYDESQCCPIYSCPPQAGTEDTGEASCVKDEKEFLHGEHVPSPTICTDCHCIDGVIVCAEIDCGIPGPNCSPVYQAEDACCPSTYECQETTPSYPALTVPTSDEPDRETILYTPPELEAVVVDEGEKTPSIPADGPEGLATTSLPEISTGKEDEISITIAPVKPSTDGTTTTDLPEETVVEDEEKLVTLLSTPSDLDDLSTRITVEQETGDELTTIEPEILTTEKPDETEKESVTQIFEITSDETPTSGTVKETEHEDKTTPMPSVSSTPSSTDEKPKVTDEGISTRITEPEVDEEEIISTTETDDSDILETSKATFDLGEEQSKMPSVTESTYSSTSVDVTDAVTVPVEQESDQKPEVSFPGVTVLTDEDSSETQRTEEPITTVSEESVDRTTLPSVTKFEESSEKTPEDIESASFKPEDTTTLSDDKKIVSTRITDPETELDSITSSPVTDAKPDTDSDSLASSTPATGTTISGVDESTSEAALTTVSVSSTDSPAEVDVSEKIPDALSSENATYSTDVSDSTVISDTDSDSLASSTPAPGTTISGVDESTSEAALTTVSVSSTDSPADVDVSEKIPDALSSENATYSTDDSDSTVISDTDSDSLASSTPAPGTTISGVDESTSEAALVTVSVSSTDSPADVDVSEKIPDALSSENATYSTDVSDSTAVSDTDSDSLASSTPATGTTMSGVDESTSEPALTTVSVSSTDSPADVDVSEKIPDALSSENATYSTNISDSTDYTKEPVLNETQSTIKPSDLTTDEYKTDSPAAESSTSIPSSPIDISESRTPASDSETSTPSMISEQDGTTPVFEDSETLSTDADEEAIKTDRPSTESQLAIETTTEKRSTIAEVSSTSSPKVDVTEGTPAAEVTETIVDGITSEPKFNQTEKIPPVGDLSLSTDETPTFAVVDEEDSAVTSPVSSAPGDEGAAPGKTNDTTVAPVTYTEHPSATKLPEISPTESTVGKLTTISAIEDEMSETTSIVPEQEEKVTSSEIGGETKPSISVTEGLTTLSPSVPTSESADDVDVTGDVVSTRITSSDATTDEKTSIDESTTPATDDITTKQTTMKGVTEQELSSTEASATTPALPIDSSITELPGDAKAPSVASESTVGSTGFSAVVTSQTTAPADEITDSSSSPSDKPEESLISEGLTKTTSSQEPTISETSSPSTPASTAHQVQETTQRTSPPPLYQTPRPGPPITGYTSAFPPFPGGLFPSSSTTWKPSTTPDFVLGPGACMFDGKVYVSAQQILRDDPCDFCFCFRGDIICLQQSCPPPVPGCFEEPIPGFCCPRYECPLTKAIVNITTTTTPLPTYPPLQRAEEIVMCEIGDRFYHTGEIVEEASGPCLECRCGNDGMMECDPKDCPASPMLGKIFTKGRSVGSES